ncbi:hypothetical protein [Mesorhizobium sp. DCY119]|uniref:hypothetical protein n=1 Tax=Mesorhizobium sp. DCY119 TaxID=2108445 RepID=UPI000E711329|nr:hypothetical protein [Mesorhizobium sp. DCY119]RJG41533.1 hypothetical protein D3Y55_30790 [Mesorhizobium sp. DCY119]
MTSQHDFKPGVFYPNQLDVLNRVVQKTCDWHGLSVKGEDARELASRAMSLFSSGLSSEEALFKRLRREPLAKRAHRAFADLTHSYRRDWRPKTLRTVRAGVLV